MLTFTTEDATHLFHDWLDALVRRGYVVEIDGTDVKLVEWGEDENGREEVIGRRVVTGPEGEDLVTEERVHFEWREIGTVHVY